MKSTPNLVVLVSQLVGSYLNLRALDAQLALSRDTLAFMTADHLGDIPNTSPLLAPGHGFGLGFAVRTHAGIADFEARTARRVVTFHASNKLKAQVDAAHAEREPVAG